MLRSVLAASILAILLCFLILGDVNTKSANGVGSLQALDTVSDKEWTLQHDVLLIRAGILVTDDHLAADERAVITSLAVLRSTVSHDGLNTGPLEALDQAFSTETNAIEVFKRSPALISSSLAYIPLLAAQSTVEQAYDDLLSHQAQLLTTAVVSLVLNDTSDNLSALVAAVAAVKAAKVAPNDLAMQRALVHHANLLVRLIPKRDSALRIIAALPIRPPLDALGSNIKRHAVLEAARASSLITALSIVSILLLMLTAWTVFKQRYSSLELIRHAAIERDTAMISTLIVGAQSEDIQEVLDEAVSCIGRRSCLDRVTLIRNGKAHLHRWTRVPGEHWPADLGRLLTDVAGEAEDSAAILGQSKAIEGLVEIRTLADAPGRAARLLAAAGTHSWAGFVFRRDGFVLGILCFEATTAHTSWPPGGPTVFRQLAHVIEEALDRERIIAERRALQERLAQAQRLEAAGALASGIAHNFNNIVGAVLGHAELAAEKIGRGAFPSDHIEEIRRAAGRASDLVDNMLNLGRRNLAFNTVDLSKLLTETVSLVCASLPHGVDVKVEALAEAATVFGRSGELQQIILNLIRNAAQACGKAGEIAIALARINISDLQNVQIGLLSQGEYLRLSVSDNGIGMNALTLGRIFDPFFTTRPAGTGLGLATVADIIRDHGGALQVVSAEGRGSVFHVWLPSAASAADAASARGDGQVVLLLVDGDRDRLYRLEDMVAALGYEPAGHPSLSAAVDSLHDGALIDAILIDATGPRRGGGAQAVVALAKARLNVPILVLGDPDDLSRLHTTSRAQVYAFDARAGATSLARALSQVQTRAGQPAQN